MAWTHGVELADGVLVGGGVEVARRLQEVAFTVVDARLERCVYDDDRVVLRIPDAEVARRVAGEVQELDPPVGPQPQGLTAAQAHVHGGVAAELRADPVSGLLVGTEAIGLGPEVDLRHHPPGALHPGPVGLAAGEPKLRVHLLEGAVAAAVVDVGVAYDYLVHVLDAEPDLSQVRDDDLLGRPCEARVDEDRSLLPEVCLDAVYPRKYLHPPRKTLVAPHYYPPCPAQRRQDRVRLCSRGEEDQPPCICPIIRPLPALAGRWTNATSRRTSRWSVCSRCRARASEASCRIWVPKGWPKTHSCRRSSQHTRSGPAG